MNKVLILPTSTLTTENNEFFIHSTEEYIKLKTEFDCVNENEFHNGFTLSNYVYRKSSMNYCYFDGLFISGIQRIKDNQLILDYLYDDLHKSIKLNNNGNNKTLDGMELYTTLTINRINVLKHFFNNKDRIKESMFNNLQTIIDCSTTLKQQWKTLQHFIELNKALQNKEIQNKQIRI